MRETVVNKLVVKFSPSQKKGIELVRPKYRGKEAFLFDDLECKAFFSREDLAYKGRFKSMPGIPQ